MGCSMVDKQSCILQNPHPEIDLDKWQRIVDLMSELYGATCGTIVQFRQGEFNAVVASENKDNFLEQNSSWPWDMKSFCRRIIETGKGLYVGDAKNSLEWNDAEPVCKGPVRSYCGLPLFWPDGTLFGTICVIDTKSTEYERTFISLLEQFRDLINADLKMVCHYGELRSLALTDELTGINNRRGFNLLAEQRLKDANRFNQNVSLIFFDINNFKLVNDSFGHEAGDDCIKTVAGLLDEICRDSDIVARLGGDEFALMLLAATEKQTAQLCSRIQRKYVKIANGIEPYANTSLSFGCAFSNDEGRLSLNELLALADRRMYQHKKDNKVIRLA